MKYCPECGSHTALDTGYDAGTEYQCESCGARFTVKDSMTKDQALALLSGTEVLTPVQRKAIATTLTKCTEDIYWSEGEGWTSSSSNC